MPAMHLLEGTDDHTHLLSCPDEHCHRCLNMLNRASECQEFDIMARPPQNVAVRHISDIFQGVLRWLSQFRPPRVR